MAAESSLTRGGVMYHFASREELLRAINSHLTDQWESSMIAVLGRDPERATPAERLAAYVQVCTHSATRAELVAMLDDVSGDEKAAAWIQVSDRWAPAPTPTASEVPAYSHEQVSTFIARLAADGLWMYESLTSRALDPELRAQVVQELSSAITSTDQTYSIVAGPQD